MNMYEFLLKCQWSLFVKVPINDIPALVQILAWCRSGHKPLSEPVMVSSLTYICVTPPERVKTYCAYTGLCLESFVNDMAADKMDSCIARTPTAMVLNMWDKQAFVFNMDGFEGPAPL